MPVVLRDYQQSGVEDIRAAFGAGHRRVLYVLPTGGGKTTIFSYIAAGIYKRGKRATVLVHRQELVDQVSDTLRDFRVPHAILDGRTRGLPTMPILVASVFTLAKRLSHIRIPDLIIGDEAHHFTPTSTWGQVVEHFGESKVLGVTATPIRLDGTGLGQTFDEMVEGPTIVDLIERGHLVRPDVYAPSVPVDLSGLHRRAGEFVTGEVEARFRKPTITGDAIAHYRKLAHNLPAVVFCCSIKHAAEVAEQFRAAGYAAVNVDGSMDRDARKKIIDGFRAGRTRILTSCSLVSEGFDVPGIYCAISLRPTASLSLWLQQVGRALRPAKGKSRAIILDHAGNTHTHGLPDEVRQWSLDGRCGAVRQASDSLALRTCQSCRAIFKPRPKCPRCGMVVEVKARMPEFRDGELELVNSQGALDIESGFAINREIPTTEHIPQAQGEGLDGYIKRVRKGLEVHARKHRYDQRWVDYALKAKIDTHKRKLAQENMRHAEGRIKTSD